MNDIIFKDNAGFKIEQNKSKPTPVQPTPAQQARLSEAMSILMWHNPFFASLLFDRLEQVQTSDVPIAATDGDAVFYNPEAFCKYDPQECVFIIAHEVMHCVLDHCIEGYKLRMRGTVPFADGTTIPYDADLMNEAQDYVINAMLIESKVGRYNPNWLFRSDFTGSMSALEVYRTLHGERKAGKGKPGQGQPGGPGGQGHCPPTPGQIAKPGQKGGGQFAFDQHLSPGVAKKQDPAAASTGRDDAGWDLSIRAAAAVARARGNMPASLDRMVQAMEEPEIDWRDHIQGFLARALGGAGWNFQRGDRRLLLRRPDPIYAPSRSGFGADCVVVAIDTSGSIRDREIGIFFGCMAGLLGDVKPRRLVVIWCDAKVQRVDELEDASDLEWLRAKGAPGGGGTRFGPVFDEVANMGLSPDALVYLTDMQGSFPPAAPNYPTLWAMLPGSPEHAPFGTHLPIPELK